MELFSEVYSCYYQVAAEVLRAAGEQALSRREIARIVEEKAFSESGLYLLPRLLEGEWPLLQREGEGWRAKVKAAGPLPPTNLQKAWMKALLADPRMGLFLSAEQEKQLAEALDGVEPLFTPAMFLDVDVAADRDPWEEARYREHFQRIITAMKAGKVLDISFTSPRKGACRGDYRPIKLEYSRKDGKFRLYGLLVSGGRSQGIFVINLGRITEIKTSRERFAGPVGLETYDAVYRCKEPARIRILPQRNALERCMLQFASYEKRTEYDEKSDSYLCTIYYNRQDETELLIRILSFGPVVRVLGPEPFLRKVRERVLRQHVLFTQSSGSYINSN